MVLNVGDSAPDFELTDPDLKMRKLSEFRGKKVVLSFIVAASSPVCETELCTFRDSWDEISKLGAQVQNALSSSLMKMESYYTNGFQRIH